MSKGTLFIFSAPSGAGKDTVLKILLQKHNNIKLSISSITRPMREGEVEGEKYNFISREAFEKMLQNDELLEYNEYVGNYYGTPKKPVFDWLNDGYDVILEIDVNGALKVKEKCPDAIMIFMLPPSINELYARLKNRGTETDEVIERRVKQAAFEISCADKYDYIFVNNVLDDAIDDLYAIIRANALLKNNMNDTLNEVLEDA